jgi:hypothetical protein
MSYVSCSRGNAVSSRTVLKWGVVGAVCLLLFVSACATVGRDFASSRVSEIHIGKTTQAEIEAMFGQPWRVGLEDGQRTWTYGKYRYRLLGQTSTEDLVIRFDKNNVVTSYTFNTTEKGK